MQPSLLDTQDDIQRRIQNSQVTPQNLKYKQNIDKWTNIEQKGMTKGFRNDYLFKKCLGIKYNNDISDKELWKILEESNNKANEPLETSEIKGIYTSILKYTKNVKKPNKYKKGKSEWKEGPYWKILNLLEIHNYKENGKEQFIRQRIGQILSTIKRNESTIQDIIKATIETYKNNELPIESNVSKYSKRSKRTLYRYNNDKGLKEKIRTTALKVYFKTLYMPNDTNKEIVIQWMDEFLENFSFSYKNSSTNISFMKDSVNNLILYEHELENAA